MLFYLIFLFTFPSLSVVRTTKALGGLVPILDCGCSTHKSAYIKASSPWSISRWLHEIIHAEQGTVLVDSDGGKCQCSRSNDTIVVLKDIRPDPTSEERRLTPVYHQIFRARSVEKASCLLLQFPIPCVYRNHNRSPENASIPAVSSSTDQDTDENHGWTCELPRLFPVAQFSLKARSDRISDTQALAEQSPSQNQG
ncbi:hypothetical protein P175DRAFT_0534923 [Aspergillus ochraceoroseus IBT 24754]|uniref:Uncharacterized protein n=1 Tax=Aspergillus ochraceoroseus IBT 24754 TaxID=1392256 RepID=A0A2T5LP25_9EURO|nr:uncharacterized protein P175DRAFT_0534923 [Aspergillus ochraceoroseus IBT 24754]PTU18025.1 hypothetical protein P175DRAFT_0534923 [Aspergillus ochraceoroseus IBT 24754]